MGQSLTFLTLWREPRLTSPLYHFLWRTIFLHQIRRVKVGIFGTDTSITFVGSRHSPFGRFGLSREGYQLTMAGWDKTYISRCSFERWSQIYAPYLQSASRNEVMNYFPLVFWPYCARGVHQPKKASSSRLLADSELERERHTESGPQLRPQVSLADTEHIFGNSDRSRIQWCTPRLKVEQSPAIYFPCKSTELWSH